MSSQSKATFLKDFEGRRVTACAIFVAALGSASLNVWGATQIFPQWQTATIFATVVSAGEAIAFLGLRSIMADHENHRYWKARLGALILILAIVGCVISGHRAFHTLSLEAQAKHDAISVRAERAQEAADAYHASRIAGTLEISDSVANARWETKQAVADRLKVDQLKSKPIAPALVYVFLALFEIVKIGGLWALATPSTRGQTRAQRKATKRSAKINEARKQAEFERKLAAALSDEASSPDLQVVA